MPTRDGIERGIGRAIVEADRALVATIGKPLLTLDEARRGRALIAERDRLVRIADDTCGPIAEGGPPEGSPRQT